MHRYILHNEDIRDASERVLCAGQVGLLSGWGVFSTIRIVEGVLFEWERHWARMSFDARLMRVPMPADCEAVHAALLQLVARNQARHATLRLVIVRNGGGMWEGPSTGRDCDVIGLTSDSKTWGRSVRLRTVPNGRHSAGKFARAKILSWAMNLTHLEEAQAEGYDEVCLLNERGEVAECTSANIFVVQDGHVWTPPLSSGCLPGVTRDVLLREVRTEGFAVGERVLRAGDFETAEEAFITSTTRDLLAISEVDGKQIRNHGRVRQSLQEAFERYVEAYVEKHREGGQKKEGSK